MHVYGNYQVNGSKNDLTFTRGTMGLYIDTYIPHSLGVDEHPLNYGSFSTGTSLFGANDGTPIAAFNLISGTGTMDYISTPQDGSTDLIWGASFLASGYWIDPDGNDMSNLTYNPLILGVTDSNNAIIHNTLNDSTIISSDLVTEFEETGLHWTSAEDATKLTSFLSSKGSFTLASPVPEPATLLLFGFGMLGLAKSFKKQS